MNQITKLEVVIKEWESKAEDLRKGSVFCGEHKFYIEAQILHDKRLLIDEMCRSIRLKVIEQLIKI